jgi:hypothetical protein
VQQLSSTRCHDGARPHKNQQSAPQNRAIMPEQCEKSGLDLQVPRPAGILLMSDLFSAGPPDSLRIKAAGMGDRLKPFMVGELTPDDLVDAVLSIKVPIAGRKRRKKA